MGRLASEMRSVSVDLFDHRALGRVNQVRAVLAMDVPVFPQRRSLPLDRLRKLLELDVVGQTLAAADDHLGGATRGLAFGRPRWCFGDIAKNRFWDPILAWTPGLQSSKISIMERAEKAIRCPKCGSLMRLSLAPGGKGPRSLRCEQCDRPDPLTAGDVSGWLRGELHPPRPGDTGMSASVKVKGAAFTRPLSSSRRPPGDLRGFVVDDLCPGYAGDVCEGRASDGISDVISLTRAPV